MVRGGEVCRSEGGWVVWAGGRAVGGGEAGACARAMCRSTNPAPSPPPPLPPHNTDCVLTAEALLEKAAERRYQAPPAPTLVARRPSA